MENGLTSCQTDSSPVCRKIDWIKELLVLLYKENTLHTEAASLPSNSVLLPRSAGDSAADITTLAG